MIFVEVIPRQRILYYTRTSDTLILRAKLFPAGSNSVYIHSMLYMFSCLMYVTMRICTRSVGGSLLLTQAPQNADLFSITLFSCFRPLTFYRRFGMWARLPLGPSRKPAIAVRRH